MIFVALAKTEGANTNVVNIVSKDYSICNPYLRQYANNGVAILSVGFSLQALPVNQSQTKGNDWIGCLG